VKNNTIVVCGLSKNCEDTIEINLNNLIELSKLLTVKNFSILIVDSSSDKTKELISKKISKHNFIKLINQDNLDTRFKSRIEKISYCRNLCLQEIKDEYKNEKVLYIPLDLDINLFDITNVNQFTKILEEFDNNPNLDAMFPTSYPYYYDIFALRASSWNGNYSQIILEKIKKLIPFSSFLANYVFIFRKQWTLEKINSKKLKVSSAFGGAGIYKLDLQNSKDFKYSYSKKHTEIISEHIYFNKHFKKLLIKNNWVIPAPIEHIYYKGLSKKSKLYYFFETLKSDFKKLATRLK